MQMFWADSGSDVMAVIGADPINEAIRRGFDRAGVLPWKRAGDSVDRRCPSIVQ